MRSGSSAAKWVERGFEHFVCAFDSKLAVKIRRRVLGVILDSSGSPQNPLSGSTPLFLKVQPQSVQMLLKLGSGEGVMGLALS